MMDGRFLCACKNHHCFYVLGMVFVTLGHLQSLDWTGRLVEIACSPRMNHDSKYKKTVTLSWMRYSTVVVILGNIYMYMCTKACVYTHCTSTNQQATCSSDTPTPARSLLRSNPVSTRIHAW